MNDREIDLAARALYEAMDNKCVPSWDQCGGVTKDVWRERVQLNAAREKVAKAQNPTLSELVEKFGAPRKLVKRTRVVAAQPQETRKIIRRSRPA